MTPAEGQEHATFILRVAVPVPLRDVFDYLPPQGVSADALLPGMRLRVPFGRRKLTGILVDTRAESEQPLEKLKHALAVLDESPLIPAPLRDLCQWSADYYQHAIGEVFAAALTPTLREGREVPKSSWRLTSRGLGLGPASLKRAKSQADAVARLQNGPVSHESLRADGVSSATLRELRKKDLMEACLPASNWPAEVTRESGPTLSAEQGLCIDAVKASADTFAVHLLEGVTGSGKTEVYLRCIEDCLRRGKQALVLIPEIGLTPQTVARFESRFSAPVALLHSGLADGRRLDHWVSGSTGAAGVVIGTRSASFTPIANLGLIVVDEEHDGSYKQQDGFRYSARDVSVKRAQLEACPVLLGSATPSLESLQNAKRGRYQHHRLRERQAGGSLPAMRIIDLRGLALRAGISDELLAEVRSTVELGGRQALLFLNRRGFAPTLQCHDCGWIADCDHCDARLTLHLRNRLLRCHHCGYQRPLDPGCPQCGSKSLLTHGLGTEQAESFLKAELSCPVYRIDSDAMRGVDAMETLLDIAHSGEPCVILGTQMLTKGHHFPAVQLVGVIDADALTYSADFRGEERMAQLLVQVSGRAGREAAGGSVVVQTHYPENPLLQTITAQNYDQIADTILEQRASSHLPPFGHLCMLRADAANESEGEEFLKAARDRSQRLLPRDTTLIGPLPAAMSRRAGRFRWQLWCLSQKRSSGLVAARRLVAAAADLKQSRDLSWFIDIDPSDVV